MSAVRRLVHSAPCLEPGKWHCRCTSLDMLLTAADIRSRGRCHPSITQTAYANKLLMGNYTHWLSNWVAGRMAPYSSASIGFSGLPAFFFCAKASHEGRTKPRRCLNCLNEAYGYRACPLTCQRSGLQSLALLGAAIHILPCCANIAVV